MLGRSLWRTLLQRSSVLQKAEHLPSASEATPLTYFNGKRCASKGPAASMDKYTAKKANQRSSRANVSGNYSHGASS